MSSITLYHVSSTEIRDPDIRRGRKNADFGQGFYPAAALRWISSDRVTEETVSRYKDLVKTEEAEYMRQFSETMEKLSE